MTEQATKKQKLNNGANSNISKCNYINLKKNRRCGLQVRKGQVFCFAHLNTGDNTDNESSSSLDTSKTDRHGKLITRVPCPFDPSHTVWSNKLTKHLKICNIIKAKETLDFKQKNCDWFDLNHNIKDLESQDDENTEIDNNEWKKFMDTCLKIYDEKIGDEQVKFNQLDIKQGLQERFDELENHKHIIQQSSLIGHVLNILNFENDKGKAKRKGNFDGTIIEFGCGRAEFTRYFNKAWTDIGENKNLKYLLVDRENPRLKFDNKITNEGGIVKRLKIDIKDLVLENAINDLNKSNKKCIGISKHLCGVATDLTLRCLENSKEKCDIEGIVVAMCCRHCCNYSILLNESKEYLLNFKIDANNFKYMKKMFAWATNGIKPGQNKFDGKDHFTGLSLGEREEIGLKMRYLLDKSREYAMEKRGWSVEIVKYCSRDTSLENNCLIVKKSGELSSI